MEPVEKERFYYRTYTFRLDGQPRTQNLTTQSGWGLLTKAVLDNTKHYWEIVHHARIANQPIVFENPVIDEQGNPKLNKLGQPRFWKRPISDIVNQLRALFENQNPYQLGSSLIQGTYWDVAENLASWYALNKEYLAGTATWGEPSFPEPHPLTEINQWMPLTFSSGKVVRLLKNASGRYFIGLPILGENNPCYRMRTIEKLIPCDGKGRVTSGSLILFPLVGIYAQQHRRMTDICESIRTEKGKLAWAQVSIDYVREVDKRRRMRRTRKSQGWIQGPWQEVFILRLVLAHKAPKLYKPRCFAGISLGPKTLASCVILDQDERVVEKQQWSGSELLSLIHQGEERLRSLREQSKPTWNAAYRKQLKSLINTQVFTIVTFLRERGAAVRLESIARVRKSTPAPPVNFLLSHWAYRQITERLKDLAIRNGMPLTHSNGSYGVRFTCSQCGATNQGIKDPTKYKVDIESETFLCSICSHREIAAVNTATNLAKQLLDE
ncbi:MAG: hypothetical protein A2666_05635 [Parcubacteria group bacterium RIFCSPHIGHO2_01_FULL_47_10b]|nr:MAG: hypothetical protein A2666_05635 [Parcubacteria group bacterium RIFCSPHIGHO2_01_FULL_47_10b]QBM02299.1 CRISPR-associated protein Cas14d.2 [uncultured archaeon]